MAVKLLDFDLKRFEVGDTVFFAIDGRIMEGPVRLAGHRQVVVEGLGSFYLIQGEYRKHNNADAYQFDAVARQVLGSFTLPRNFTLPS
jgi:hypothetical protein